MINTGLTDTEKESLLKLFLTWSALRQEDDGSYTFTMCRLTHLDKRYADLIVGSMQNLRNSALGFDMDRRSMSKECLENLSGKEVYIVKYRDIYDSDNQEFIIGVGSTYDEAVKIIKEEIKNVSSCYFSYRFFIEHWELDKRYMGGLTQTFTKEQNIEWAKELGVYAE